MRKEQNFFELRKLKVGRHRELTFVWHSVTIVLLFGLGLHLSMMIRTADVNAIISALLFALLLYGDLKLRKWVILPAIASLGYFLFFDQFSFWLVLYMGLAYAYLRIKIKFFPPADHYDAINKLAKYDKPAA